MPPLKSIQPGHLKTRRVGIHNMMEGRGGCQNQSLGDLQKGALENFAKFIETTCADNKVAGLQLVTFSKRRLQHRFFPVNLTKFLRTSSFIEHFPWLLLGCVSVFAYGVIQCQVWQKWRKSVESFQLAKMDKKLVINLTFCKSIHLI